MGTLSLRLPASIHAKISEMARREGFSINQFINSAVAEKLITLKVNIAKELKQNGIQTLLTRPEDLNVTTINKYFSILCWFLKYPLLFER